jgi:uncharacterized metal-binding protein
MNRMSIYVKVSEMPAAKKILIFLCSGAAKAGNKKLSYRIATRLETLGIAGIGTLHDMSEQHSTLRELQERMIFINDCRSGCVNVFTHGFDKNRYIFFDVSPFLTTPGFDIDNYIHSEIFPRLKEKWSYSLSQKAI